MTIVQIVNIVACGCEPTKIECSQPSQPTPTTTTTTSSPIAQTSSTFALKRRMKTTFTVTAFFASVASASGAYFSADPCLARPPRANPPRLLTPFLPRLRTGSVVPPPAVRRVRQEVRAREPAVRDARHRRRGVRLRVDGRPVLPVRGRGGQLRLRLHLHADGAADVRLRGGGGARGGEGRVRGGRGRAKGGRGTGGEG